MNEMRGFLSLFALFFALVAEAQVATFKVSVSNPLKTDRMDQPVRLSLDGQGPVTSARVMTDGVEVPCQLIDFDQDDSNDELCFLADVKGREVKTYSVTLNDGPQREYPARVYAEMVMRNDKVKEKNKQNNYVESLTVRGDCAYSYNLLHHHGVDFESELNGIRIYFDKRQTLDLYGKFQKRLELQQTQFYTSDEQKLQGYGDDVLWVGNTFGLGAFRGWNGTEPTMVDPVRSRTQRIVSYGPVCAVVEVIDRGWEVPQVHDSSTPPLPNSSTPKLLDMTLRYTQWAGHRDTDVEVMFKGDASDQLFSTGIINVKGSVEYSDKQGLRGCWGTDYPSTDTIKWKPETVGLAILLNKENIVSEEPANKDNYAFVVRPQSIDFRPQTSDFRPQTSDDGLQTLDLRPQTSDFRPQTLDLRPQTSDFRPQTSDLRPQTSDFRPQESTMNYELSTMNYKVAYCSDNETFGFHSAEEWFEWLQQWRREVDNPVRVTVE